MPTLDEPQLLIEVATALVTKSKVLFLTRTEQEATSKANAFRNMFLDQVSKTLSISRVLVEQRYLKPAILNPCFVALIPKGWVFFHPADDLEADEPIGDPLQVYWPTQDGVYAVVPYSEWQKARRRGIVWRPNAQPVPKKGTLWDHLSDATRDDEECL